MLDLGKLRNISYRFTDEGVEHETNNPTQELYTKYQQVDETNEEALKDLIKETLESILKEEDKHYISELTAMQALVLIRDYFKFHEGLLGTRFPGSVASDK